MKWQSLFRWTIFFVCGLSSFASTPEVIGQWPTIPGGAIQGLTLYESQPLACDPVPCPQRRILFAKFPYGVAVLDISDPSAIRRVSVLGNDRSSFTAAGPFVQESVINETGPSTFRLLSFQEPLDPAVIYSVTNEAGALPTGVAAWPYLYQWLQTGWLKVYDFTNPLAPVERAAFQRPYAHIAAIAGDVLAAVEWNGPLRFWDISNRTNPVPRGSYTGPEFPEGQTRPEVRIEGTRAYVLEPNRISVLDISNLDSPTRIGGWDTGFPPTALDVANGIAVVGSQFVGPAKILNLTDPAKPVFLNTLPHIIPRYIVHRGSTWFVSDYQTVFAYELSIPAYPRPLSEYSVPIFPRRLGVAGNVVLPLTSTVQLDFLSIEQPDRLRQVGSSRVDLQACKLEYSIVSPK